jgi:hypothetical protein
VERRNDETAQQRDLRAVISSARWYAEHLKTAAPKAQLVLVTDEADCRKQLEALPPIPQLSVLSLSDYLKKYYPKQPEMRDL